MIGAIIGDIIGSRFEFGATPEEGFELPTVHTRMIPFAPLL